MIETKALLFKDEYATYDLFKDEIKSSLVANFSALLGVSDSDSFTKLYDASCNYVLQLVYNYYYEYYLTSVDKATFIRMFNIVLSGKLPSRKVLIDKYLIASTINYDKLRGVTNEITHSVTNDTSGSSKVASTPEDIGSDVDFVENYSTSGQKYSNKRSESGNNKYDGLTTASGKDLWENIKSIPSIIYKEVAGAFSKCFFSEISEEGTNPSAWEYVTYLLKIIEKNLNLITFTNVIIDIGE